MSRATDTGDGESAERGMKEDEDTDEEEDEPGEVGASSQQVFSSQLTEVQQRYKGQLAKKLKEVRVLVFRGQGFELTQ